MNQLITSFLILLLSINGLVDGYRISNLENEVNQLKLKRLK
jgi:hypothetical protein